MTVTVDGTNGITFPNSTLQTSAGIILQFATTSTDGVLTATTNGVPSTITNGVQIFSLSFTPLKATSIILVQTSAISISEETNSADIPWLALWQGSTFVCANSGSPFYTHFSGNLNYSQPSINNTIASWGTTAATIQVRGGMNAGSTVYVNGNSSANYTGSSARIAMTIMEIAA